MVNIRQSKAKTTVPKAIVPKDKGKGKAKGESSRQTGNRVQADVTPSKKKLHLKVGFKAIKF